MGTAGSTVPRGTWISLIFETIGRGIASPTPQSLRRGHMKGGVNPEATFGRAEVREGSLPAIAFGGQAATPSRNGNSADSG